jgi:hypothetical protein
MAGFADSFAEGFAGTFGSAYKSSASKYISDLEAEAKAEVTAEKDKLKDAVTRFNTRLDKWRENESKDLEYKSIAMNTVATYGGKVPEDAWKTIYTELWSGRTIENIREDIDKKGFVEVKTMPETDSGTVDDQTNAVLGTSTAEKIESSDTGSAKLDDGLWTRVIKQESGGKQTNSEGETLESSKGALGISQSLVSTAANPGFGAKSIFDLADAAGIKYANKDENTARALLDNKDLNESFGKGYLEALLKRYNGDQEKALIAYNAGADVADKFTGDRSTLPEETQGYLKNIIGEGTSSVNSNNESQDNWAVYAQDKPLVLKALGIEGELYDKVIKGFTPEFPALKYAWNTVKDKDQPDWKITDKIRKENWRSFEAAAIEAGDPTRGAFIRSLGEKLEDPEKPPKYLDANNFTNKNSVEGMKLAAEYDLANAKTDAEKDQAKAGIDLTTKYLERIAGDAWYLEGDLNMSNVQGRIAKATAKGDMKALAYFNKFVKDNTQLIPDNLSIGYISSAYAEKAIKAANGTEADKQDFNNWKQTELPILITAIRLNDKESGKATTLIDAYDELAKAKEAKDTDAIKLAEKRIKDLLNLEAQKEIVSRGSAPILLIKRETDETGAFTGKFEQITGYIKPDPNNPGKAVFQDSDGTTLEGYEELSEGVDKQARQVVSTLSTEIKKYQDNRVQAVGAVRLFGDIADIVEADERVLTSVAGFTVQVDSALRNFSVGIGLLDDMFKKKGGALDAEITLKDVQLELRNKGILEPGQTLEDLASTPVTSLELSDSAKGLAQRKAIFEAKMILFTFRAGGLEGQSGQAMSNKDFDRLRKMLTAGGGKQAFLNATQSYVNDRVTAVRDQWGRFDENPDLRSFFNRHNYNPLNNEPAARNIDDVIADNESDDRLKRGSDYLSKKFELVAPPEDDKKKDGEVPEMDLTSSITAYNEGKEIVVTPEFYERFKTQLDEKGIKVGQKIKRTVNVGGQ